MGKLPLGGGDEEAGYLANMCKLLLNLPHSTADPEHLFSIIGKVDTSQRSSLLPSTLFNIVSVKFKNTTESKIYSCHICFAGADLGGARPGSFEPPFD